MLDLLTDRTIPVSLGGRGGLVLDTVTLPRLYSYLALDEIESFPGLARHQSQAWYQFLAQLGAIAAHRAQSGETPKSPSEWHSLLSALTPGCSDTAWSLVVADASKPAFMQMPTARVGEYKTQAVSPSELDILVTSKNHDRKSGPVAASAVHAWLFALVAAQTSHGYSGRNNYGIARMNGGTSSRVLVDRRPSGRWGLRVMRAIRMLVIQRRRVLNRVSDDMYRATGGLALTWLRSWDTDAQIEVDTLDPYFIEVCRRLRLVIGPDGDISALGTGSKRARINAKDLKGHLGDPWVPVIHDKKGVKALTVSGRGFDYRLVHRILFDKAIDRPLALAAIEDEGESDTEIHLLVLAREQGKTQGLQERIVPLAHSKRIRFGDDADEGYTSLAKLSEEMVGKASLARKVLRQAILVYLHGPEHPNWKGAEARPVVASFDRAIDGSFFDLLFTAPQRGFDVVDEQWQRFLKDEAIKYATRAWDRYSPPSARREKARAKAQAVLFGGLRKCVPEAFAAAIPNPSAE